MLVFGLQKKITRSENHLEKKWAKFGTNATHLKNKLHYERTNIFFNIKTLNALNKYLHKSQNHGFDFH